MDRLNAEIHKAISTDEMKKRFADFGAEAAPTTPGAFTALIKSEIASWTQGSEGRRHKARVTVDRSL